MDGTGLAHDPLAVYRSGSTEPWTVDIICAILKAQRPSFVIETGTFEGLTTRRIFEVLDSLEFSSRLVTIEQELERAQLVRMASCTWETSRVGVTVIHGDALEVLRSMTDNSTDAVFLDDDHTPEHVGREAFEALRILRPGGILLMHDVVGHFGLGGICRALGGAVLDLPRLHAAGGLGIVTK